MVDWLKRLKEKARLDVKHDRPFETIEDRPFEMIEDSVISGILFGSQNKI